MLLRSQMCADIANRGRLKRRPCGLVGTHAPHAEHYEERRVFRVRTIFLLAARRGKTAFFISSSDKVLPAANCRRDFAMIFINSGCELKARDSRSTFFNGTTAATGLLRSVTSTICSSNSFAYSASDRDALASFIVFITQSPYRLFEQHFFPFSPRPRCGPRPGRQERLHRMPEGCRFVTPKGRRGSDAKVFDSASRPTVRAITVARSLPTPLIALSPSMLPNAFSHRRRT